MWYHVLCLLRPHPTSLETRLWVLITLACVHVLNSIGKKDEEYRGHLGSFGVTGELALRPIASLSGGQKSRLAFALMAMPR